MNSNAHTNENTNENRLHRISPQQWFTLGIFNVCILVGFDLWTKQMAVTHLKEQPALQLIPNVLQLQYLENTGAAFGIFAGSQILFRILTVCFLIAAAYFLIRLPRNRHYLPMFLSVCVLTAGAIGNFIDRISQGYVVDFIYFSIINFPIFNVADIYVSLSVICLILLFLFKYKENEFDFLKKWKRD